MLRPPKRLRGDWPTGGQNSALSPRYATGSKKVKIIFVRKHPTVSFDRTPVSLDSNLIKKVCYKTGSVASGSGFPTRLSCRIA